MTKLCFGQVSLFPCFHIHLLHACLPLPCPLSHPHMLSLANISRSSLVQSKFPSSSHPPSHTPVIPFSSLISSYCSLSFLHFTFLLSLSFHYFTHFFSSLLIAFLLTVSLAFSCTQFFPSLPLNYIPPPVSLSPPPPPITFHHSVYPSPSRFITLST